MIGITRIVSVHYDRSFSISYCTYKFGSHLSEEVTGTEKEIEKARLSLYDKAREQVLGDIQEEIDKDEFFAEGVELIMSEELDKIRDRLLQRNILRKKRKQRNN